MIPHVSFFVLLFISWTQRSHAGSCRCLCGSSSNIFGAVSGYGSGQGPGSSGKCIPDISEVVQSQQLKLIQSRARSSNQHLIRVSDEEPAKWLTDDDLSSLVQKNVKFMDMTDNPNAIKVQNLVRIGKATINNCYKIINLKPGLRSLICTIVMPKEAQYLKTVKSYIKNLSISGIRDFVLKFSGFPTRYYNTSEGVESGKWLLAQVRDSVTGSRYKGPISVRTFRHNWPQRSIIARIEGSHPRLKCQVVILGAHMDSLAKGPDKYTNAPGADDDASGSVVVLEALRALLEGGFRPQRSLEFHWYAAEEVGLKGSQALANLYASQGVQVAAMLNFDVSGWTDGEEAIALHVDFTDPALTEFMRRIIEAYSTWPWTEFKCGFACSDHASWTQSGYPSAIPVKRTFSPYMHTMNDTMSTVSCVQVREISKLGVAYAVELGLPS